MATACLQAGHHTQKESLNCYTQKQNKINFGVYVSPDDKPGDNGMFLLKLNKIIYKNNSSSGLLHALPT